MYHYWTKFHKKKLGTKQIKKNKDRNHLMVEPSLTAVQENSLLGVRL